MRPTKAIYPVSWCQIFLIPEIGQKTTKAGQYIPIFCQPLELDGELNAYVEADTCKITLDFEDFPFDPRVLRGGVIKVFVDDAGQPITAGDHFKSLGALELRQRCTFMGVVDEVRSEWQDSGRTTVLECRDFTAFFLDATLVAATDAITWVKEGKNLTLVEILQDLVSQRDSTKRIEIRVQARTPAEVEAITKITPADYKLRASDPATGKRKVRQGETVWDAVQELALEAGLTARIELDQLVLAEPKTLNPEQFDPMKDRVVEFTLGEDVAEYSASRQLGRQHGISVRVSSYNPDTQTILSHQIVDERSQVAASKVETDPEQSKKATATVRPFVVRAYTQTQVEKIAEAIFTQLRHHELEGSVVTKEMSDRNGHFFTEFRYGDPVIVDASPDMRSVLAESAAEQLDRFLGEGYDQASAEAIAASKEALRVPFYLERVRYRVRADPEDAFDLVVRVRSRKQVILGAAAAPLEQDVGITVED